MKILIVGAGIVGLSLARRLDAMAMDYTLIERSAGWAQDGAGICLPANAVAGLDKLGLKAALLAVSHQVSQVNYVKANGDLLASASLLEAPLNQQPFLALPRVKLLDLLRQGMNDKVSFGLSLQDIEQLPTGGANVTFSDGQSQHFDCIVGADGIHSQVRHLAFEHPDLEDLAVTNWRFMIDQDTSDLQPTYYLGSDSFFMRYPMPDNQVYCYAHVIDEQSKLLKGVDKQWLQQQFRDFDQPVRDAIAALTDQHDIIAGRLKAVKSRQVCHRAVVLIGDALHGCPPTLQQGVGMGLEDVHCLADLLAKQQDVCTTLTAFKQQRLTRISWVIDESNRVVRLASKGRSFIGRWIRNLIIKKNGPANVVGWRKLME